MESLIAYLEREWGVITQAPVTFVVGGLIIAVIAYLVARHSFADRLATAEAHRQLLNARLAEYGERLQGASPDEAKAQIDALKKRIEAIEPRRLSDESQTRMVSILSRWNGSLALVSVDSGSPSAIQLHRQLMIVFRSAAWKVHTAQAHFHHSLPRTGVYVSFPSGDERKQACVEEALKVGGLDFEFAEHPVPPLPNIGRVDVEIIVTDRMGGV